MRRQRGSTLSELVTTLAIAAIFAAIAVPGAARVRSTISGGEAARRLTLVLRTAQAQAQETGTPVRVQVDPNGEYLVRLTVGGSVTTGSLGTTVASTYPGGAVEFSAKGTACLPGSSTPRAGHFTITGSARAPVVTLQLSGCVRCA